MTRLILIALCLNSLSSAEYEGHAGYWVEVTATAYSPHDALDRDSVFTKDFVTADGTDWRRRPYGVAVPRQHGLAAFVEYGSQIIIPTGYGYLDRCRKEDRTFVADDTGAIISAKTEQGPVHIDLRFKDEADALRFGKKQIQVFIVCEPTLAKNP